MPERKTTGEFPSDELASFHDSVGVEGYVSAAFFSGKTSDAWCRNSIGAPRTNRGPGPMGPGWGRRTEGGCRRGAAGRCNLGKRISIRGMLPFPGATRRLPVSTRENGPACPLCRRGTVSSRRREDFVTKIIYCSENFIHSKAGLAASLRYRSDEFSNWSGNVVHPEQRARPSRCARLWLG